jgi:YgiT-type zinc finger domain-containing protein
LTTHEKCTACYIGSLYPKRLTHTRVTENELIVLPNVEAYVCDVCGSIHRKMDGIARLEFLLGEPAPEIEQKKLRDARHGSSTRVLILANNRGRNA